MNVFIQVCLCVLTKLFNLNQSLRFAWFWQLLVFHFEGDITLRIPPHEPAFCVCVCVCVCVLREQSYRMCMCCTCADNYTSVSTGKTSGQDGKCIWTLRRQSAGMVVIQTMVNMLAKTNQWIFHLLLLQAIYSSFWQSTVHCNVKVQRGTVGVYNLCVCVCACVSVREGGWKSLKVHKHVYPHK